MQSVALPADCRRTSLTQTPPDDVLSTTNRTFLSSLLKTYRARGFSLKEPMLRWALLVTRPYFTTRAVIDWNRVCLTNSYPVSHDQEGNIIASYERCNIAYFLVSNRAYTRAQSSLISTLFQFVLVPQQCLTNLDPTSFPGSFISRPGGGGREMKEPGNEVDLGLAACPVLLLFV